MKSFNISYWQILYRTLSFMFKIVPIASLLIVASTVWQVVSTLLNLWFLKQSIDSAILFAQANISFWIGPGKWVAAATVLSLLDVALTQSSTYLRSYAEKKLKQNFKENMLIRISGIPIAVFEEPGLYDHMHRANFALQQSILSFLNTATSTTIALFTIITITSIVLSYSWLLFIVLLLINIPHLLSRSIFAGKLHKIESETTQTRRLSEYYKTLITQKTSAKEIRLYGIADYLITKWLDTVKVLLKLRLSVVSKNEKTTFLFRTLRSVVYVICVAVACNLVVENSITIGSFALLVQALIQYQNYFDLITSQISLFVQSCKRMGDYYTFIDLCDVELRKLKLSASHSKLTSVHCIKFNSVSFKYPGKDKYILKDISFTINSKEKIALVGENGAGKSTLIKLLLGLYYPTEGNITINGIDVTHFDPKSLHLSMSAVFQDFVQYHLSFRENIGFGNINDINNDIKLYEISEKVEVDHIILASQDGLDTLLGNQFTGGRELSGGQWQRIALARGFLKQNVVIVLDEPTSSFDPRIEVNMYKKFFELANENTSIFVTHRIGLARFSDRIIVLNDGQIIEQGTHSELMNTEGQYSKLFNIQAQWYRDKAVPG